MKEVEAICNKVRRATGLRKLARESGVSLSTIMRIRKQEGYRPSIAVLEVLWLYFNEIKKRGKK